MSALAPTLQAFFTDRLLRQRHASPHTIAAYAMRCGCCSSSPKSAPASSHPNSTSTISTRL